MNQQTREPTTIPTNEGGRTTQLVSDGGSIEDPLTAYDLELLKEYAHQIKKRDTLRHFVPIWVSISWFVVVDWFVTHQWDFLKAELGDGWYHGLVLVLPALVLNWCVYILMFLDKVRSGSNERIETKIENMFEGSEDEKADVIQDLQTALARQSSTRRK